jgi:hypothetical protein
VTIAVVDGKPRPQPAWLIAGLLLMAYAVIGNWLALPGYRRFLVQGHQSSNGGADLALILGASKTILWMLSFHLGAFCLSGRRSGRRATPHAPSGVGSVWARSPGSVCGSYRTGPALMLRSSPEAVC